MKNLDFFLRSVVRALESFHNNEVLGRPEIWSRVRIVTVFDENIGKGLDEVNESKDGFVEQVKSLTAEIDALVIPKYKTSDDILIDNVLNGEINRLGGPIKYSDIDVVFSFTAMPNFTRACAHYSSKRMVIVLKIQNQITNLNGEEEQFTMKIYI